MEKRVTFNNRLLPYLLLAPQMAITLIFFFWPSAQAVWQSLVTEDAFGGNTKFVWFQNFTSLLSDPNYYDEEVQLCTRISYSGEYLHSAPWNMADHGKRNSSHGCINLSPEDAQWVFDNFILGDVVEVKNSPKPLPVWDGLGDWQLSYDQY